MRKLAGLIVVALLSLGLTPCLEPVCSAVSAPRCCCGDSGVCGCAGDQGLPARAPDPVPATQTAAPEQDLLPPSAPGLWRLAANVNPAGDSARGFALTALRQTHLDPGTLRC